jgi:hypothetical protein
MFSVMFEYSITFEYCVTNRYCLDDMKSTIYFHQWENVLHEKLNHIQIAMHSNP